MHYTIYIAACAETMSCRRSRT